MNAAPRLLCLAGMVFASMAWAQSAKPQATAPFTREVERCILPAATYHQVNAQILRAILVVESGLNPRAIGKNANGTFDIGLGQMNSMHFRELRQWGIAPEHLMDPCVSTYVAAWHLRRSMDQGGNTWAGIARYHSATPYFNQRYQALLFNELVKVGVLEGPPVRVPPLRPQGSPVAQIAQQQKPANPDPPLLVYDTSSTK